MPILVGLSGRGVAPLTWLAAVMALAGMSLLEGGGGSPPALGDLWSFLSAVAFGVQVRWLPMPPAGHDLLCVYAVL